MTRYAAGDLEAFDALFWRHQPRARAFFLKRTGSPQRAEDLYQELFLRLHRARERYDPARPFTRWFFQIANRLLVDDHRRVFGRCEASIEDRDPPVDQPGSEEELANREQIDQLLGKLSPEERYVLLSSKVDGLGYPELGRHLGKSPDAVRKMASRAIQRLRAGPGEPLGTAAASQL